MISELSSALEEVRAVLSGPRFSKLYRAIQLQLSTSEGDQMLVETDIPPEGLETSPADQIARHQTVQKEAKIRPAHSPDVKPNLEKTTAMPEPTRHPPGCSCGSPDCPEWQAAHEIPRKYDYVPYPALPRGEGPQAEWDGPWLLY